MRKHGLLVGTIVFSSLVVISIIVSAVFTGLYEHADCHDSETVVDALDCYSKSMDLWKDAMIALFGVLIISLWFIGFQATAANFLVAK